MTASTVILFVTVDSTINCFIVDGDYSYLDQVYIRSDEIFDEGCNEDDLLRLIFDSSGNYRHDCVSLSTAVLSINDGAKVIECGLS